MSKHILFARSNFSIGESILDLKTIVGQAKEKGYDAVAVADTMNISCMINFFNLCKKNEIKGIIGVRLRIVEETEEGDEAKKANGRAWYPKLYVKNEEGLKTIFKLLTLANSKNRFYYVPRLYFKDLLDNLNDNVFVTLGDIHSAISRKDIDNIVKNIVDAVGASNVITEVLPFNTPIFARLAKESYSLMQKYDIKTLETGLALYDENKSESLIVMQAIAKNAKINDGWVNRPFYKNAHIKDVGELLKDFDILEAEVNKRYKSEIQLELAGEDFINQFNYEWKKMDIALPKLCENEFDELKRQCLEGWSKKLECSVFNYIPSEDDLREKYVPRLKYELSVIKKLNFSKYFLLVQHLVGWSKNNDIMVGPGRGSSSGSLISYLLGITEVDPIRFNLIFERFINPSRQDLPDIDLDFMSERRGEVIKYATEKFGQDKVAGITNYTTLGAAGTIRALGRIYSLTESQIACSKKAPKEHGESYGLAEAAELTPEINIFKENFPKIWEHALNIEGMIQSYGQHAAGLVIADIPLEERASLENRSQQTVVNWDKRVVEDQGLIKIDILGLSTLDVIKYVLDNIFERHHKKIDILDIDLDDNKVLQMFVDGRTKGIFQFEGRGMTDLLKKMGSLNGLTFNDLVATTALYRPGPMESGLLDKYVAIKLGYQEPSYVHKNAIEALEETFGVMVYQEQVMKLTVDLAGFTLVEADKLRKAIGKKDIDKMQELKEKFIEGCMSHSDLSVTRAENTWREIEAFAGYGFNKSHAVAYTLISYINMYLKTYYPVEFYAGVLTVLKEDKLLSIIKEAEELGITVDAPHINYSSDKFEILTDNKMLIPFNRCKGIADKTCEAILNARKDGKFISVEDLQNRVVKRNCNKNHMSILEKVGAFASLEPMSPPVNAKCRLKDQIELIPGLINAKVKADRIIKITDIEIDTIRNIISEYGQLIETIGGISVIPRVGKKAKFMVISDSPNKIEEGERKFASGKSFGSIKSALESNGLKDSDGYYTGLLKMPKGDSMITKEEINHFYPYLKREIELLRPPVIVLLGSMITKLLLPSLSGGNVENAGESFYDPDLDATIVVGINPGMIYFDPSKQTLLDKTFAQVKEIVE